MAAALSLLLPAQIRLGSWLPLHLALAGAVSAAISGNMQSFAAALSAGPSPPRAASAIQFVLMNAGALLVAVGYPARTPLVVALGGGAFAAGAVLLAIMVIGSWRRGINRRHGVAIALYVAAAGAVLAGAGIGALLGSGSVSDPATWLGLRSAHVVLNLLGWASLAIVGTLSTFLPTVIRVRMPAGGEAATAYALVGGLAALGAGLGWRQPGLAMLGSAAYAAGAFGVLVRVVRTLRAPRRHPAPIAGRHLLAGAVWFALSSAGLVAVLLTGPKGFDRFRPVLLAGFAGGWILQTLLGSWLYLLPSRAAGGPDRRRLLLAAVERGGRAALALVNGGLVLLAGGLLAHASVVVAAGTALALAGAVSVLVRAVAFEAISRTPRTAELAVRIWGPRP